MMKKTILSFIRRLSGAERNFQRLDQLSERIARIELLIGNQTELQNLRDEYLAPIRELCTQEIYNTLSLHSISENGYKRLYIPGGSQKYYDFPLIDDKLALGLKSKSSECAASCIFIISNMKSGTYFLGKILSNLGIVDVNIHAGNNEFTDHNNRSIEQQLNHDTEYLVGLPFYLQFQFMTSGQFLLGHIDFQYADLLKNQKKFCCIRELRHVVVSMLRFCQRRGFCSGRPWFALGETEAALFELLNDADLASYIVCLTKNIVKWCEKFPESVIVYEHLLDEQSLFHEKILEQIASITEKPIETVRIARQKALGEATHSYSGKPSTLTGLWSERVEEKFQELGLHLLNKALGYPDEWQRERERERERERVCVCVTP